jgi:hypothetical protein
LQRKKLSIRLGAGYVEHFQRLRTFVCSLVNRNDANSMTVYLNAIDELEGFFDTTCGNQAGDQSSVPDADAKIPFA